MRTFSRSLLMVLFAALFMFAQSSLLQAAESVISVAYYYNEDGTNPSAWEASYGSIELYSNKTSGTNGATSKRAIYVTITTPSSKQLRLQKKGDSTDVVMMSDTDWKTGTSLSITPEEVTDGSVTDLTYKASFRLDVMSVPSGGKSGIRIEVNQFDGADLTIPIEIITLPETAGEQPKDIVLGSGSATNKVAGEKNPILNGAHYSLDGKAGPMDRVIRSIVSNTAALKVEQDDKGQWQFSYEEGGSNGFDSSLQSIQEAVATLTFVYADSTEKTLDISFIYSPAPHPVSSITIVPEGKKSIPRMLDSTTETVYFSVYANKSNKNTEWVMNEYHKTNGFLDFSVETSDGEPSSIAEVVYNQDKGFCIVPKAGETGAFTVKAFYTADKSKSVSMSFALVSENQEVYWRDNGSDDEASLTKAFPAAKFIPTSVSSGAYTVNNVYAEFYLSSTSGFFTGSLANYKDALIFADPDSEYKEKTWKIETSDSKVVSASLSGTKLTMKPVAIGEATVKLISYDEHYIVTMPVTVKMPEYTAVSIAYKSGKETITNYVYKADFPDRNMSIDLVAGKSVSIKARYVNRDLSEKDFDMPQGNGYWYSTNPLYLTVSSSGTVKALGKPANDEKVKAVFINNEGAEVAEITINISAKAQVVDQWEDTIEVSYKQGKIKGSIFKGKSANGILTVNLHDKPFTLTTTVEQVSSSGKVSVKKPKVYYVSEDPTKVHVSAKGVLTPVGVTDDNRLVTIKVYSKDAGAGMEEASFQVKVLAPSN